MDYKNANLNKHKSEGSIAQWYLIHETMAFCESYLEEENDGEEASTSSTPTFSLSVVSNDVQGFGKLKRKWNLSRTDVDEAHWAVLLNCDEIVPYKDYHQTSVARDLVDHKITFPNYLRQWIMNQYENYPQHYNQELHQLAGGPQRWRVRAGAFVNGVKFVATERDAGHVTQNNGVMAEGKGGELFYGVLLSVVELVYGSGMEVVLFKCKWFDSNPRRRPSARPTIVTDRHGFLSIDTNSSWYEHEPYILATSAKQIFFIDDPVKGAGWKVVQLMSHRNIWSSSTLGEDLEDEASGSRTASSSSRAPRNVQPIEPYQEDTPRIVVDTGNIREPVEHEHQIIDIVQVNNVDDEDDDDEDSPRASEESEEPDDSEDEDFEI